MFGSEGNVCIRSNRFVLEIKKSIGTKSTERACGR
jgi:hypothetical protein